VGARCAPETCPPLFHPDTGEIVTGECGWEKSEVYLAEAEQCGGGACLVFRHEEGESEPYCSRRCGRSGGGACPDGYRCFSALAHEDMSHGCYCVDEDQLNLAEGSHDWEGIWTCRQ
jgi:hypothetical protein